MFGGFWDTFVPISENNVFALILGNGVLSCPDFWEKTFSSQCILPLRDDVFTNLGIDHLQFTSLALLPNLHN